MVSFRISFLPDIVIEFDVDADVDLDVYIVSRIQCVSTTMLHVACNV